MDLTSHPEISGSTVLHIYDVQRGTGSLVQPTSMWCVVCVTHHGVLLAHRARGLHLVVWISTST